MKNSPPGSEPTRADSNHCWAGVETRWQRQLESTCLFLYETYIAQSTAYGLDSITKDEN